MRGGPCVAVLGEAAVTVAGSRGSPWCTCGAEGVGGLTGLSVPLSRNLCLGEWSLSSSPYWCLSRPTWKQFFLNQRRHKHRVTSAELEDFVCKEGAGNLAVATGNLISLC